MWEKAHIQFYKRTNGGIAIAAAFLIIMIVLGSSSVLLWPAAIVIAIAVDAFKPRRVRKHDLLPPPTDSEVHVPRSKPVKATEIAEPMWHVQVRKGIMSFGYSKAIATEAADFVIPEARRQFRDTGTTDVPTLLKLALASLAKV